MTSVRIRRAAAIILFALSFAFQSAMLHTDHEKLFRVLTMASMIAGVVVFPANAKPGIKTRAVMVIAFLICLILFTLMLAMTHI